MITEAEAAILLETTRRAFGNQSQSKQRSTLNKNKNVSKIRMSLFFDQSRNIYDLLIILIFNTKKMHAV